MTLDLSANIVIQNGSEPLSYQQYVDRLNQEQKGALQYLETDDILWNIPSSLIDKAASRDRLKPFYGDTTVFPLSKQDTISL